MFPFRWEVLKVAAGSKLARSAILAPLLGWMIVKNDEFGKFLAAWLKVDSLALPSHSFQLFYCGLFLFGLGVLVHSFNCPQEILEYTSQEDFRTRRLRTMTESDARWMKSKTGSSEIVTSTSGIEGTALSHDQFLRDNQSGLLDLLATYYQLQNKSKFWYRVVASLFVCFGAALTFIPSILTFRAVVVVLLQAAGWVKSVAV